jgi:hypothetical protein
VCAVCVCVCEVRAQRDCQQQRDTCSEVLCSDARVSLQVPPMLVLVLTNTTHTPVCLSLALNTMGSL